MSTSDILRVVGLVAGHGTKAIVLSGGEPTLLRDLTRILHYMKSYNLSVVLSTNGILLNRRLDEIVPYIDWVALPLDAPTSEENQRMRVGHSQTLEIVLNMMPAIRSRYPHVKIKLGTVVSRINMYSIVNIPEILSPERIPNLWKIYQVTYRNYGYDNQHLLEISDKEFQDIAELARDKARTQGIPFIARKRLGRDGKHLFIDPNGDAFAIQRDEEVLIGNILVDPQYLMEVLPQYIDSEKLMAHFEANYP